MPVTSDNIVTQEEISKWPYLDRVKIPHIEANIGLLIGANAPQVMEPWEIINSYGNGPYAIRTPLGWVVNGLSETSSTCRDEIGTHPRLLLTGFLLGGLKNCSEVSIITTSVKTLLREEMSREDLHGNVFMEIMTNSVKLQEGHYSLRLPFRNNDKQLKCCQTEVQWLEKKA